MSGTPFHCVGLRAVEALRVGVRAVDVERAGAGVEGAVVVAGQRDRDAVGAGLVLQVLHVVAAGGRAVVVLVLDLVGDDRAGAVGELVAGDDAGRSGSATRRRTCRKRGSSLRLFSAFVVSQPGRPPLSTSALMYGAGRAITYSPACCGHVQQLVDVADAGEVIDPGTRRVVAPVEVQRGGVEPGGLHLLEDVAPQVGARAAGSSGTRPTTGRCAGRRP